MRRRNSIEVKVDAPSRGLQTTLPSDLQKRRGGEKFVVSAKNARAEDGQLKNAPGHERIHTSPVNLPTPANLIYQPNIVSVDPERQKVPLIGTEGRLYAMRKRARVVTCPVGCQIVVGVIGDSGSVYTPTKDVAELVRSWSPDMVLHTGDIVYNNGGNWEDDNHYEHQFAQWYHWALGSYGGIYSTGGNAPGIFFPAPGNHDFTDGPITRYNEFFDLPNSGQYYYDIKRGPAHFFFLNSYGYGPNTGETGPGGGAIAGTGAASGVGEADLSENGPMYTWLAEKLAATDAQVRIVIHHHPSHTSSALYKPGYSALDWNWTALGVDMVLSGHSHSYERLEVDTIPMYVVGCSGHSLRDFDETPVTGSQFRYTEDYGALKLTINSNTVTAEFYSRDGTLQDYSQVTTGRPPTVCYVGDMAKQATALTVRPSTQTLKPGQSFPYDAYLEYTDGTVELVTTKAAWRIGNEATASVSASGVVTGVSLGTTQVRATYEGLEGVAEVVVEAECSDAPVDVVLVFDRSGSMETTGPGGRTRISRAVEAAKLLFESGDIEDGDQFALVTFAGGARSQTSDVTVDSLFTSDVAELSGKLDAISPAGATGIAAAVSTAGGLFDDPSHKDGNTKIIILFTDGYSNVLDGHTPLPTDSATMAAAITAAMDAVDTEATAVKAAGIKLIVVGLDIRQNPTLWAQAQAWASDGFYYDADDADELLAIFAGILQDFCQGAPPPDPGDPDDPVSPADPDTPTPNPSPGVDPGTNTPGCPGT